MLTPLVLDLDGSVQAISSARKLPLQNWQEALRFGCSWKTFNNFSLELDRYEVGPGNIAFLGSGDFHHITLSLLKRFGFEKNLHLVVFDNHPDNMLYPFGIHCGSWVYHAAKLPFVKRVTVIGITSSDLSGFHLLENHLGPLWSGKLRYICLKKFSRLSRRLLCSRSLDKDKLVSLSEPELADALRIEGPVYLSIDKDAVSKQELYTNWDQGVLSCSDLLSLVSKLKTDLVGADITGDLSRYRYGSLTKRLLAKLDGQQSESAEVAALAMEQHRALNQALLELLASSVGRSAAKVAPTSI